MAEVVLPGAPFLGQFQAAYALVDALIARAIQRFAAKDLAPVPTRLVRFDCCVEEHFLSFVMTGEAAQRERASVEAHFNRRGDEFDLVQVVWCGRFDSIEFDRELICRLLGDELRPVTLDGARSSA